MLHFQVYCKLLFFFYFLLIYLFIYLFIYLSIYLSLAALGLHCCVWAFSSCGNRGLLFLVVHRLLIAVASHCGARALEHRLSSCGTQA